MATKVTINGARANFLHVFTPQSNTNDDGTVTEKFSGNFIIAPDHAAVALIKAAMIEAATAKWGANAAAMLASFESSKKCLRNGDAQLDKQGSPRKGYPGNLFLVASNKTKPTLFSNLKDPATGKARQLTVDDGTLYDGCYVNVLIDIYPVDKPKIRGVFAELRGIQFAGDGERLGGTAPASADEFGCEEAKADMSDLF